MLPHSDSRPSGRAMKEIGMAQGTITATRRAEAAASGVERLRIDKFGARRIELAEAALETLAELGYARTSLREIAQKSDFTHGVLHYYFTDKVDLICCSVRHYKATCVTRYDQVVAAARSRDELLDGFLDKLGETMRVEAHMHRLWYDLRAQALFEDAFRDDVKAIDKSLEDMVWRIACSFAGFDGKQPAVSPSALYAVFDGLFQKYLLRYLSHDGDAIGEFLAEVRRIVPAIA
jgi:AcrR family transcriptional regulator